VAGPVPREEGDSGAGGESCDRDRRGGVSPGLPSVTSVRENKITVNWGE
jgi:hypothetical protein